MKTKITIALIILVNIHLFAQKHFFSFDKVKVENIASIENCYNSIVSESKLECVESKKDSLIRYGKLKNYFRPINKYFGKIGVTYYYLKSDTIVKKISYNWIAPEDSKLKDYCKQFDKTTKKISADLDLPIGEQGKLSKIIDDFVEEIPVEITERRVTWDYRGAKILIVMIWSKKHGAYLSTEIKWGK